MSILDISKTLMYEFHYGYMIPKFKNNLHLLYTDTDSLIYNIYTDDVYNDIKGDLYEYFDTSNYKTSNPYSFPLINKKVLGKIKDEYGGELITEFVGLRSKMYGILVNEFFHAKAKGVNKSSTKKLRMRDYINCLDDVDLKLYDQMYRFKSIAHVLHTMSINKISLSSKDDKRILLQNSTNTLAWGHYRWNM